MAFPALLDACVLVPAALRDTLLRAADAYLYRALWSEDILTEVARVLVRDLRKDPARVAYLLDKIRRHLP